MGGLSGKLWFGMVICINLMLGTLVGAQQEKPFNGERSFASGLNWLDNNAEAQLSDFTTIRLSSNTVTKARADKISNLGMELLVALSTQDMLPTKYDWPGTVLADSNTSGPLYEFKQGLNNWSNDSSIVVHDVFFDHEMPYDTIMTYTGMDKNVWTAKMVSGLYADLIHAYKRALRNVYPQARLWLYAGTHEESPEDSFEEYKNACTDWEAITNSPDRPDIGACTAWLSAAPNHYEHYKEQAKGDIRDTHALMNGVPMAVVFSAHRSDPADPDGLNTDTPTYVRNTCQDDWEKIKQFIREVKATADSANSLNSPGFNSPTQWYMYHYFDEQGHRHPYTKDTDLIDPPVSLNGFAVPYKDFPYRDTPYATSKDYPARMWASGASNWDWGQAVNQWEAEFIANYLEGVGYPVAGHQITSSTTWSGEVILTGDVEVTSGATLTILPGTRIYLRPGTDLYESGEDTGKIEIVVAGGNLIANGTQNDPITFASALAMDRVGKGTVYDTPDKGDWLGIRQEGGSLSLNHCFIDHANIGVEVSGGSNLALINTTIGYGDTGVKIAGLNNGEQVWIENSTIIGHRDGYGITVVGSPTFSLVNSTLRDNKYAVTLDNTSSMVAEILNCDISNVDGSIGGDTAINAVNNPEFNLSYSNIYGFSINYAGSINGWPHPANGVGAEGENRGNFALDPKYFNSVDELNTDSPLIDAGKPDPTMSDPNDGTRINIGRYGGTALAKASVAGGGQVLFYDAFTGGTSKWHFEQGSWNQTNDRLERTASDGGVITINTAGATSWTDYSFEFQMNGRDGGALVRTQDTENGVALIVRPNWNDVYWHVKQNGDWGPQYNKVTVGGLQGQTILVKVTVVGDVFTAYINGVVVTSLTNTTFSSGKVGLYSGGGTTQFTWYDDVSVTSLGGSSGGGTPIVLLDETFTYAHGTEPAPGWIDAGDAGLVHWKVKNNEYVLESSNENVNRAYRQVSATEYVLETKIRFDASEGKVIYSHGDQHELYRLDLMADSDRFRLMINDQPTTVFTTVNRNQWYGVKIEAKSGNYVKVWIDNTLTHDVSTSLSFDGWMGAGSYNHVNDGVVFDDFRVSTLGTSGGGGGSTPFTNGNFELGDLTGWTISGSGNPWAINNTWPLHNTQYGPQIGLEGDYCAGTNEYEWYTGTMISGNFTINQPYLNFKIGGHDGPSNNDGHNKIELRRASDHAVLFTESTPGTNDLVQRNWYVNSYINETVYIACIDNHSGGGHAWLSVDDFQLASAAAKPTVVPQVFAKTVDTLPDTFTVAQNMPNPFNPTTTIAYTLPTASNVSLKIYNALGQEVRILMQNKVSAGRHQVVWDGRDALGQMVSSGIYFYRFQAGPLDETRKMLILK